MTKKQPLGDWILLASLILLWSTSFIFIEITLESFTPIGIVTVRMLLGAAVLSGVLIYKKQRLPTDLTSWLVLLSFAIFGTMLPFYLIALGQQSITSGMAGLLMAVMPLATMILAHYFVPDETLNRYKLIGFVMGITGVAIVLYPAASSGENKVMGILIVLMASLSYGLNSILVRRLPSFEPVVAGAGTLIVASLVMTPIWLLDGIPWGQSINPSAWWALLWLGIVQTGIAMIIYFAIIGRAGPTFLANINYVIPVLAYFAGALLLGEVIEFSGIAALALIISGVAVTRYMPKPKVV